MWNNVRQLNLAANALFALLALALLAAGAYWLTQRPAFTLRTIAIGGDVDHINAPTVRAGVVGHLKGNFFTVDLDNARQALSRCRGCAVRACGACGPMRLPSRSRNTNRL